MAMRRCHYCNKAPGDTKDHIVPKALSGPNIQWNYVRSCQPCNGEKADEWPTCPCGVCLLAVEMYLWCKEKSSDIERHWAVAAAKHFQTRLWEERIVRMEWWEDAGWIDNDLYRAKTKARVSLRARRKRELRESYERMTEEWREGSA